MLRNQIGEKEATYEDPIMGVNLRAGNEGLQPGEARLMQNIIYRGGTRLRTGCRRINGSSYGAFAIRGGTKYYFGGASPQKERLIAYDTKISSIDDLGAETVLTSGMASDYPTYFRTWPITDSVYISNGVDTLRKYDGNTTTFSTIGGTNPPVVRGRVVPVLDRMLAITTDGIERTDPRVDNVWSKNSSWATLRPQTPGLFTAIHPTSIKGTDTIYPGALAFQERSYYLITGTDYGDDVTQATASAGENVSIQLIDPIVGTSSPNAICTVPGLGTFWFTSDLNVYYIPEGSLSGIYIGDKLQSTVSTPGIEAVNQGALDRVWMEYFDNYLMLGIPLSTNVYASEQWWLDTRMLRGSSGTPVWYGPMDTQRITTSWVENQQGDNFLIGGEGDSARGAWVYQMRVPGKYDDDVADDELPVTGTYHTYFKDFGSPSREKYVQAVHFDINEYEGDVTVDIKTLTEDLATAVPVQAIPPDVPA